MKRQEIIMKVVLLFLLLIPSSVRGAMSDYCSTPPLVSSSIPPNVLIVLDNSGSMNDQAYAGSYDPTQFVSGSYYGYFDPAKNYIYSNNGRWEVTALPMTSGTTANPIASGNLLNWATTRRIDAAKKLLIGGKASPRSPQGAVTVKLYGENASLAWYFQKDLDNSSLPGLIYPFVGNYHYSMSGSNLRITPVSPGSTTFSVYPNNDISIPVGWNIFGAPTAYQAVDEAVSDGDSTYIQSQNTSQPAILDYNYTGSKLGTITSVTVRVVAKRSTSSSVTRRIQGVIRLAGVDYSSNWSNITSSYSTYNFTWSTNPSTAVAWDWNDIKSSGIGSLQGFGVKAYTSYASVFPRATQVYLIISSSTPSGGPYSIIVDQGMQKAEGIMDRLSSGVRFGLSFYNNGCGIECGYVGGQRDGGHIENYVDFGSTTNMITSISNMSPSTWTPLAETFYEMVRYFRQESPAYSNAPADYQTGPLYDPYYYQYSKLLGSGLSDQYVRCAKSFILMLTDGESTMDQNIPTNLRDYDADGKDPGVYPSFGTDYLDDVALWARTVDNRADLAGNQNIILYPVFMFGKGSQLLKDAAINGGFNDLNGDLKPGPDLNEYLRDSNGDGVINTADLPLTYYEGDDGYELEASITDAIAEILKRAASGTAVSVLTTSSRGIGSMVQAYFLPTRQEGVREVTWTGYLQNLWIDPKDNLREDTTNDFKLNLGQDKVLKLFFDKSNNETKGALFTTNVDGGDDGTASSLTQCSTPQIKAFSDVSYLWEGGKKLALMAPSLRNISTSKYVRSGGSLIYDFSTNNSFTVTNINNTPALSAALNPDVTYTAENIVRYIRGECLETGVSGDTACGSTVSPAYRDRRVTVSASLKVWKLGDIINSTPKVFANTPLNTYHVDYADSTYYQYVTSNSYKQRSAIAFVGANDGMLHAFRVGYLKDKGDSFGALPASVKALFKNLFGSADTQTDKIGEEVWGYIPFNAFPYLKYLADPSYCHIYYNDLSVRLVDVSIGGNPTDTRTSSSWKTILIGGMRFGGACSGADANPTGPPAGTPANVGFASYFAIDITDPENPVSLWEFSEPDLGYTTTFPSIIRTGNNTMNGNWYVVFGSGSKQLPKSATDIARTSTGYMYVLDLKTGSIAKKIALDHNAIVSDILAIDADKDYVAEKVYFGTSYKSTSWKGKLVAIDIPNQDLTAAWTPTIKYLFSDNYPFTASPDAAKDNTGNIWVYAGSGKFNSDLDKVDNSAQIFLGLMDKASGITYPLATTGLSDRTSVATTGTVTGTTQMCLYDASTNSFSNKTVVTSITPTSSLALVPTNGWFITLSSLERVISRPLAVGGLVDFLTYKPSADICSAGGESFLFSLGYTTGVAPVNVAILAPETTGGQTTGTVTVAKGVLLGSGAPPTGEAIIIPPPKEGEGNLKKKIQIGSGAILEAENETANSIISSIVHWLKK